MVKFRFFILSTPPVTTLLHISMVCQVLTRMEITKPCRTIVAEHPEVFQVCFTLAGIENKSINQSIIPSGSVKLIVVKPMLAVLSVPRVLVTTQ